MRIPLALIAIAISQPSYAGNSMLWGESYPAFGFNESMQKEKQELEPQLPPYPTRENLIEFTPDAGNANKFFLDRHSISFSSDGVIRYSIRIKSPQGAETTSFEGIRCLPTIERKIYAFGRPDNQWAKNQYARWRPLNLASTPPTIRHLSRSIFCADEVIKSPAVLKEITKKIDSIANPLGG